MSIINLKSSQLKAIEFDPLNNKLKVWFMIKKLKSGKISGGSVYEYSNVTESIYNTILNAKTNLSFECSHGKCFHQLVRSKPNEFPYLKIS